MCGFVGFIDHDHIKDPEKVVDHMSRAIIHRGPDDHGLGQITIIIFFKLSKTIDSRFIS